MSREILYKKTSEKEPKKDYLLKPSKDSNFIEKKESIKILNEEDLSLSKWIKSHKLINISALCKEAGINRSNFDKSLKMDSIPEKHEKILIDILKRYGYKK
jgi:DNA-binding phage protein